MASRKTHCKSRFGCLPCKRRHIKCGEEHPSCHNCIKRSADCTYGLLPGSGLGPQATSREDIHENKQDTGARLPLTCNFKQDRDSPNQSFVKITRLLELQLMIHYMTNTCDTMAHNLDDIEVWRKVVPEEAVQHEFLMEGLLALSSLHFAHQSTDLRWQYTEIAIHYHSSGLRKYTDALRSITSDNSPALFAFSIIITILALAFSKACPVPPSHTLRYDSIVTMFELLQGVRFISQGVGSSLRQGKFAALFRPVSQDDDELFTPSGDVNGALGRLRERADSITESSSSERHEAYLSGIESLQTAFGQMEASSYLGPVIAWPTMVSEKLLTLFKQGDHMAELIIIHYGVLLLYARNRWWGRGIGANLIESLATSLCDADPVWATWTEWAREAAALSDW